MTEKLTATQIKERYGDHIDLPEDILYFPFMTTGTEGMRKTIFMQVEGIATMFKKVFKHANYNGEKVLVTAPPDHAYLACLKTVTDNIVYDYEVNNLIKHINNNEVKYIFSVPSFIWNFKDHLKINKEQILLLGGEVISPNLFDHLKSQEVNCYHFFGSSEYSLIGVKKMEDEYYDFLSDDVDIKEDGHIYSPYMCKGFINEKEFIKVGNPYKPGDIFEVKGRQFKFISRADSVAKINGNSVSLTDINKMLGENKKILDFVLFKTNLNNELDELALVYVGEIEEEEIKKYILDYFNNFNYLPKKIKKIEKFPLAGAGKKDMIKVREWMK